MTSDYQETDYAIVDYQTYCLDESLFDPQTKAPFLLRGPKPYSLHKVPYFVCIGAAQTFGRFCDKPFPLLLQETLGIPGVNLGRGGAGAAFFLRNNSLLMEYINKSSFAIVQVMSGRSASNSLFESQGIGYYRRRSDGSGVSADEAFTEVLAHGGKQYIKRIVEESRNDWITGYQALFAQINVPTILLWLSVRKPRYWQRYSSVSSLFGPFPQLINQQTLNSVRQYCDYYVECASSRGMPQPLTNRFTGELTFVDDQWGGGIWNNNWYYPSPEMHVEAASALLGVIKKITAAR